MFSKHGFRTKNGTQFYLLMHTRDTIPFDMILMKCNYITSFRAYLDCEIVRNSIQHPVRK